MHRFDLAHGVRRKFNLPALLGLLAASCSQNNAPAAPVASKQALDVQDLAKACKLQCPARGIAEGNASISGVASVDAFFQAVLDYRAKADNVSSAIDAQLAAVRGDFGLAADEDLGSALTTSISQNTEGSLIVDNEPAQCSVDTDATIRALAKCDASVKPGKATCGCHGKCKLDADANVDCGSNAQLACAATAPMVSCQGQCRGLCSMQLDAAAACDGICRGTCAGKCSVFAGNLKGGLECAGKCDGQCKGRCDAHLAAAAQCNGMCQGECTTVPGSSSCQAGARAECQAMGDAMVDCKGRCQGELEPPKAKAECETSARAQAKLNAHCTPPELVLKYQIKSTLDASASAQFVAACTNLQTRLPALLAAVGEANSVTEAQAQLIGDGSAAVSNAIHEALADKSMVQARLVGLGCALRQLDQVGTAIDKSSKHLAASLDAAAKLQAALMITSS